MAVYYALGDALVTEEEFNEKRALGSIANFSRILRDRRSDAVLEFSTGILTDDNLMEEIVPFEKVELGKPLTIVVRHVYTGKFPESSFFDRTKDMLITSAMKSIATYNAAPRAVNFILKDIQANHNISNIAATDQGTPLIHYTPALTERNTVLTLEIGFDEFPDEIFDIVGRVLTQAAGIPLFVSSNAYLLAAGAITKLLGGLGSRVFDHSPVFKATEGLRFESPGEAPPQADFRLVTEKDADPAILQNYKVRPNGLVDENGRLYNGDIAYIIISLDGRKHDEYKDFTATAASTALLERFYRIQGGQEQTLGPLFDALKIYNDWTFRKKADKVNEELDKLPQDSDEHKKKKIEYDALVANILDVLLKPKE